MALKINGKPITSFLPKPFDEFSDRELRWLYHYLYEKHNIDERLPHYEDISQLERNKKIASFIKKHSDSDDIITSIKDTLKDSAPNKEHIEWIDKKDKRLLIWIVNNHQLMSRFPRIHSLHDQFPGDQYNSIILAIDLWEVKLQKKIDFLLTMKKKWTRCKTPDTDIDWISCKDHSQLVWAWEYLIKKNKQIKRVEPLSDNDYHIAILASFDEISTRYNHDSLTILLIGMRKSWTQKKYRDSQETKKSYSFLLEIETKQKLDWLSENSGQKQTAILEQLINESYTKAQKS